VPNNTSGSRRQRFLNLYRIFASLGIAAALVMLGILLTRPAPSAVPSATEIAHVVNGPVKFERPSAMEYVAKTNSCVVGGVVASAQWHVGNKTVVVGDANVDTVDYTSFSFKSDNGRVFTVSHNGALFLDPGENLGLELYCDAATMNTAPSFGLVAIVYGGK
jgi:hypothetical protein